LVKNWELIVTTIQMTIATNNQKIQEDRLAQVEKMLESLVKEFWEIGG